MWTIEIDYTTGNSFGSERGTEEIGCVFEHLDDAKTALGYIKEHYAAVQAEECSTNYYHRSRGLKFDIEAFKSRPWYSKDYWTGSLFVPIGTEEQKISAFWTGYFETLHGAKIRAIGDSDMEFTL
jgi:hypothetical protein